LQFIHVFEFDGWMPRRTVDGGAGVLNALLPGPVSGGGLKGVTAVPGAGVKFLQRLSRRRFAVPMIIASAALAIIVNEVTYKNTVDALRVGAATTEVRIAAAGVLQLLTDAETGQRGYLLTGRSEYLSPLEAAKLQVPQMRLTVARFLEASGPEGHAEALRMDGNIRETLSEIERTIKLERAGDRQTALRIVDAGLGRHRMDDIRTLFGTSLVAAANRQQMAGISIDDSLWINRLAVITLTLLGAIALSFYVRHLRLFDEERAERQRDMQGEINARTAELRELAGNLVTAREDEKAHLARELHDELGGLLTAAKLDVARMRKKVLNEPAMLERLDQLNQHLNEGIALKRRVVEDLRPSSLDTLGLATSLGILCSDVSERAGLPVLTTLDEVSLNDAGNLAVYRLVQEGLTNVLKYAQAHEVRVSVSREPNRVRVRIVDDGVGFDPTVAKSSTHGIAGMRFRVESLGGALSVTSSAGAGTQLEAVLPVDGPGAS
jgi:signal transduction histidine kinase